MKPHEEWLFKAEHDLESSKLLLRSQKSLADIAIYHTQQCGEKSLKAYLVFHNKEIRKVHNLRVLIEECIEIDSSMETLYEDCIFLDPYATLYRYPEGDLMPEINEVKDAVSAGERVFIKIKESIG